MNHDLKKKKGPLYDGRVSEDALDPETLGSLERVCLALPSEWDESATNTMMGSEVSQKLRKLTLDGALPRS